MFKITELDVDNLLPKEICCLPHKENKDRPSNFCNCFEAGTHNRVLHEVKELSVEVDVHQIYETILKHNQTCSIGDLSWELKLAEAISQNKKILRITKIKGE